MDADRCRRDRGPGPEGGWFLMASIRPRADMHGKYELAYLDVDGRRYRLNTGTRDKKIAEIWLRKAEELLSLAQLGLRERVGRITREVVSGQAAPTRPERLRLEDYEAKYLERGEHDLELAGRTLEVIRCAFASFRGVVGNPYLEAIADEDVRRWKRALSDRHFSRTTVAMYQRALKTAFSRAVRWKLAARSPFTDVEMPSTKSEQRPRKSMSFEEVRLLLSLIKEGMFRRYVQFILYTACRRNEVLGLRTEDLDLAERTIAVRSSKTHRQLVLPINRALMRVIEEMRANHELPESGYIFTSDSIRHRRNQGKPWHPSSMSHLFKDYLRLAGLPEHYSLHSCRHTYVTYLRSKGIPQDVVQRLVGHSSVQTTDVYDHTSALFFRGIADMVDYEAEPEGDLARDGQ